MAGKSLAVLAGLMLGLAVSAGSAEAMGDKIVVASKIDTEGALLGNMIAQVLEHAGLPVENKVSLGPTKIVRTAILSGDIDIYPEYTGNAGFFFNVDSDPAWKNAEQGYEKAKSLDAANKIVWLTPAPANNTWAISVRGDVAGQNKLKSMDDFGKWVASGGIRLQAQRRPASRPLRRRHVGDRESGRRADLGRELGDGLRHRRPARRPRPRRHE
jgi:osmoprotectant transport system substrate-binding protein